MNNDQTAEYDIIIAGAGIAGTVLASSLYRKDPSLSILLLEAGSDPSKTEFAATAAIPANAPLLQHSELDWDYLSTPQKNLNDRSLYLGGGKGIGGGSNINYGLWSRGDAVDYDDWAKLVGDDRWSWKGFLPYFRKTETHHAPEIDHNLRGSDGPVHTANAKSSKRNYVLREPLKAAFKAIGIEQIADYNGGSQLGFAEPEEARTKGLRVVASAAYPLNGVHVLTEALVRCVIFSDDKVATGFQLADGRIFSAKREVVLSAGAVRTPQILLLSGIGPKEELDRHSIPQIADSPAVGNNLWDHLAVSQPWKLRNPESGAAFGSPAFNDPAYMYGNAMDWWINLSLPHPALKDALTQDNAGKLEKDHRLPGPPRSHVGFTVWYVALGGPMPFDGTMVSTLCLNHQPTSRGTITLASADPNEKPVVENNHFSTEKDKLCLRWATRKVIDLWDSPAGKEIVIGAWAPEGSKPLGKDTTDEEIDELVRRTAG